MAKGIGLIGNFKGKVGNMVGYKLTASNSGNTQGVRVYQPIVKNPKTSAQAEQRAKLAPINATYRALKMVIDRGNEGLPYGNKSRLAWLKQAFKADNMPWIEKGKTVNAPVLCLLTKGSLPGIEAGTSGTYITISASGVTSATPVSTIGGVSSAFLSAFNFLKEGDQLTFVAVSKSSNGIASSIYSIVIDSTSTAAATAFTCDEDEIQIQLDVDAFAAAVIVSRMGDNGEHLRSTSYLDTENDVSTSAPYDATSKTAAIESYMSSAAVNADWAEESIQ